MAAPIEEILARRVDSFVSHGHPHNFVELFGGSLVPLSFYEPDPNTHRGNFYYNSRENKLYKRLIGAGGKKVWRAVGDC